MSDDVMIAVDPHKASNTAAVLDPVTRTLIESARFANSADGYEQLTGLARRWDKTSSTPATDAVSAICSRTASPTSRSSSPRCAAASQAEPPSILRS